MLETCGGSGTHNKTIVLHGTLKLKQQTNADRIRSMTDEELAEFISGKARTFGEEYEGYMSALDWLKQEVESNDS